MHVAGLAHAQDNIAPKNKQLKQPKVITQIRVKIPASLSLLREKCAQISLQQPDQIGALDAR
jgi:hypothetical protein